MNIDPKDLEKLERRIQLVLGHLAVVLNHADTNGHLDKSDIYRLEASETVLREQVQLIDRLQGGTEQKLSENEGWAFPGTAASQHYVMNHMTLCHRWRLYNGPMSELSPLYPVCVVCRAELKRLGKQE